jgi:hypothetical protein
MPSSPESRVPDLNAEDVTTLFTIGERDPAAEISPRQPYPPASLSALLACGFIEQAGTPPRYHVTQAGQDYITSRGGGLNES